MPDLPPSRKQLERKEGGRKRNRAPTGGGHTKWACRTCDETVYGLPLNTHCTALDGPAVVCISTKRD